jgi:hypothetical protein
VDLYVFLHSQDVQVVVIQFIVVDHIIVKPQQDLKRFKTTVIIATHVMSIVVFVVLDAVNAQVIVCVVINFLNRNFVRLANTGIAWITSIMLDPVNYVKNENCIVVFVNIYYGLFTWDLYRPKKVKDQTIPCFTQCFRAVNVMQSLWPASATFLRLNL